MKYSCPKGTNEKFLVSTKNKKISYNYKRFFFQIIIKKINNGKEKNLKAKDTLAKIANKNQI